jgi:hypothetical protein
VPLPARHVRSVVREPKPQDTVPARARAGTIWPVKGPYISYKCFHSKPFVPSLSISLQPVAASPLLFSLAFSHDPATPPLDRSPRPSTFPRHRCAPPPSRPRCLGSRRHSLPARGAASPTHHRQPSPRLLLPPSSPPHSSSPPAATPHPSSPALAPAGLPAPAATTCTAS